MNDLDTLAAAAQIAFMPQAVSWDTQPEHARETWRRVVRAIIPLVAADAVARERCAAIADAKVAAIEELVADSGKATDARVAALMAFQTIAAAIRAGEQP